MIGAPDGQRNEEGRAMTGVQFFNAPDGRPIGMLVPHDFDDFESHRPTFETDEEREWLKSYYRVESPDLERRTKAHITDDDLPLQVTVLARPAGAFVNPHWHRNEAPPAGETRHQVMVCMSGSARVGLFAKEGAHVADVVLGPGDLLLMYEGHSIETLEDGTRLIEVKQGPMPEDPFGDSIALAHVAASA
jgi:hypothetical protein